MSADLSSPAGDRVLVEDFLRRRNQDSFLRLYRAHTPALFRMAWRLGWLSPADAEDVVQDTWLRAAKHLASFRFDSSIRTWLMGILINCMRERRRSSPSAPVDLQAEPSAPWSSGDRRVDLDRAIAALPPRMREVFLLFDVEGFTHAEIAALLEIDPGTSKSQLFAARRKLREALTAGPRPVPFGKTHHG